MRSSNVNPSLRYASSLLGFAEAVTPFLIRSAKSGNLCDCESFGAPFILFTEPETLSTKEFFVLARSDCDCPGGARVVIELSCLCIFEDRGGTLESCLLEASLLNWLILDWPREFVAEEPGTERGGAFAVVEEPGGVASGGGFLAFVAPVALAFKLLVFFPFDGPTGIGDRLVPSRALVADDPEEPLDGILGIEGNLSPIPLKLSLTLSKNDFPAFVPED